LDPYKKLESNVKALDVQVVALQWKWLFIYPEQQVVSVNELKIPARTPINFEITADGPMSAFWVPNLGTQTYAMTGMTAKLSLIADREGIYRGSNSNISGEGYADMHFNAVAVPEDEFATWAKETAIERDSKGYHFEWPEYAELAKPSKANKIAYYHLHDPDLFNKIIAKYMHGGSASDQDSMEGHGH
jgi:cytochrome o ubiquinol oxidase subunit 2